MDPTDDLARITAPLKTIGKRLVIDSYHVAPFQFNTKTYTTQNYISPPIAKIFGRLAESGISGRWELLEIMRTKLRSMDIFREEGKSFSKFSFDFRESNVQMYNSNGGEAFPALFYVFGLCATVIAVAGVALLVECRNMIKRAVLASRKAFKRCLANLAGYLTRSKVNVLKGGQMVH